MNDDRSPRPGLVCCVESQPQRVLTAAGQIDAGAGETVRFDLVSGGHWYGHGFSHVQPYPLETGEVVNDAFAVNNVQCPIWMCSAGFAILAETTAMLRVRINAKGVPGVPVAQPPPAVSSPSRGRLGHTGPVPPPAGGSGELEIVCPDEPITLRVFRGDDLPSAQHQLMAHLGWPNEPPDPRFLGDCVFCTWTQYPRCITQARVIGMARAIREHGYPCSTITIDDIWESAYGELRFSPDFPDPAGMVRELHEMGFQVLLWVTPFVNREAGTFEDVARRGLLVRQRGQAPRNGSEPVPFSAAMLRWWGGEAGLIDLTNPAGREWYRAQLVRLRDEVGVDGFKIDGGDAKYQPPVEESVWHDYRGPSGYTDALLALFEEVAPGRCETRTAWLSQGRRIVWRQGGKDSHWGLDNGLAAVVSLGLHMSLMGYDLFMPDMIPGRVQTMAADAPLPTDELMVRWTEVSAFMPVMQFSYLPWNYGPATAAACRAYALAHKALAPYLAACATDRTAPVVRPLWYDQPDRTDLYGIADAFLLGPDLLAAPVLEEGATARDVILPRGRWRDVWTGDVHEEDALDSHPAPCPGIPVFVRAENAPLFDALHAALSPIRRGSVPVGSTTATWSAGVDRDLNVTG